MSKMKRQPIEWDKIFANDVTEKVLISKMYKQLIQLNLKQQQQQQKKNNQKIGRRTESTFLQRRHTDGQKLYEKMFNIASYQRNANQNYSELLPNTSQNGHHQKVYK